MVEETACGTSNKDAHVNCGEKEKVLSNVDDEDAIWKRTRARYSLTQFSLDELETFLQETDDEDDFHNVDDEEEYRKFLTAVLHGGDGGDRQDLEKENVEGDDEDDEEDNDADFELELEELLESDADERDKDQNVEYVRTRRRPETRQNRREKASSQYKKKELAQQPKRALRPLLPMVPGRAVVPFNRGNAIPQIAAPSYLSSVGQEGLINGFTLQQIGQLYSLIHEHVQLLIQVFSLCILDPARQHIASQVESLIIEMLKECDEVKSRKRIRYPNICFSPPNVCSSVVDEHPIILDPSSNASSTNGRSICSSLISRSGWVPSVSGSVVSVLDVAPLSLARGYFNDVHSAVSEHRKRQIDSDSTSDDWYQRVPLFEHVSPFVETNGDVLTGNSSLALRTAAPGQQLPRKTLAASIVERVKKQSIALVPKEISSLVRQFGLLFNPALFPHKPPPAAVANRILFSGAEDELLALGMMEYNTDWEVIKQRFLPCKSKHQIFVRQKNCCSSKAPENPVKAVRKMKTSSLSVEEVERIHEALRYFKHDWISVWKVAVPYRDPSLLPRQWRIASGTQKSYKLDAAQKEKRRIYEANRRRLKAAYSGSWPLEYDMEADPADKAARGNTGEDNHVDSAKSYVHQAFLADSRSSIFSSATPAGEGPNIRNDNGPHPMHGFPCPSYQCSNAGLMQPNRHDSETRSNISKSKIYLMPYRVRRNKGSHLVKLAPDLPLVNLPPSVRVISQSVFTSNQGRMRSICGASNSVQPNVDPPRPHVINVDTTNMVNSMKEKASTPCPEASAVIHDKSIVEERSTDSDLRLHPLLLQASTEGHLPYYSQSCSAGVSSSFSFFSGNQPQLYLNLFHNPQSVNCVDNRSSKMVEKNSASSGIEFHPLLQRTDEENDVMVTGYASLGGKSSKRGNPVSAVQQPSLSGAPRLSSPNEKANELDLDMHLSSSSSKERARRSEAANTNRQKLSDQGSGGTGKAHNNSAPSQSCGNICSNQSNLTSVADTLPISTDVVRRCNLDGTGDQSLPEIVMEQEELSDSDEEIEEHVEFECEEMADSDGEEVSGCEVSGEVQNYDVASTGRNKTSGDSDDQQCEPTNADHPEGDTCVPKAFSPFLKLGLTSLEKESTGTSWLSLDSCAPVNAPRTEDSLEESAISGNPAASESAPGHPNRLCKRTAASMKGVATQNDAVDLAQQLSLGPLDVSPLRRPRKRAC